MIRGFAGTILWACLAGALGIGLFLVKHEVKDQEARLASINQEILRNQEEMHVLKAEWSYLNDPARLRQLAEKHLGMRPIDANQVVASLDALPAAGATPAFAALPADRIRPAAAPAEAREIAKADPPHLPAPTRTEAEAPPRRPQPVGKPAASHQIAAGPKPAAAPVRHLAAAGVPSLAASDVVGTSGEAR